MVIRTLQSSTPATVVATGVLAVGVAVAFSGPAAADPPSPAPVEPAPAADAAPIGLVPPRGLLQGFVPDGAMAPGSGYDFLLGQAPLPAAPGGQPGQPPAPLLLDENAIRALRPTNFGLAGQGQESIYSYTPAAPDAPPGGLLDSIRGARGLFHYPMGKLDVNQLGEPLPGTAPPPGTNIPLGLDWPEPPPVPEGPTPAPPPPGA
jgi:hypothetical protein